MRAGAITSAIVHAGVLTLVFLGTPKPFDAATGETVAVDLVRSDEAPPAPQKPPDPPPQEQVTLPEPEPKPELFIPPRETKFSTVPQPPTPPPSKQPASAPTNSPPPRGAAKPPQPSPQQPAQQQPAQQQQPAPPQQPSQPNPPTRSAAATPNQPQPQPQPQPQAQPSQQPPPQQPPPDPASSPPPPSSGTPSIFDPATIPTLVEMTPKAPTDAAAPVIGFDAPAEASADLKREDVAIFKAHLKKCMRLPGGVDPARKLAVVMRVFLRPDGALASDPMLVSGPAAREGPLIVQAATAALKACQPYAFLPADKYNEWKVLDLSVSPADMSGG